MRRGRRLLLPLSTLNGLKITSFCVHSFVNFGEVTTAYHLRIVVDVVLDLFRLLLRCSVCLGVQYPINCIFFRKRKI